MGIVGQYHQPLAGSCSIRNEGEIISTEHQAIIQEVIAFIYSLKESQ